MAAPTSIAPVDLACLDGPVKETLLKTPIGTDKPHRDPMDLSQRELFFQRMAGPNGNFDVPNITEFGFEELPEEEKCPHKGGETVALKVLEAYVANKEKTAKVFEELLIDHDPALNIGNWLWLSASAFFHQYFRVYSPIAFGKKYDKTGKYIRKYVPVLKKLPTEYIYEPWKAPASVLKQAGVKLGENYPHPIVAHDEISKINMKRMKAAYEMGRKGGSGSQVPSTISMVSEATGAVAGAEHDSDDDSAGEVPAAAKRKARAKAAAGNTVKKAKGEK
ncbi:hypothetical protein HDU96_009124 [Phlyctochytrium bullatum]|nr:hypothetical protein HDU96_009124 [Phlyctochytrium bullatum]